MSVFELLATIFVLGPKLQTGGEGKGGTGRHIAAIAREQPNMAVDAPVEGLQCCIALPAATRSLLSSEEFELIYQPVPPVRSSDAFASVLKTVVGEGDTLAIASPYLSTDVLRPLIEGRRFRLVTDEDACFESAPSASLLDLFARHSDHIRSVRGLHAKVVLGSRAALFGSANLTTMGLCHRFEMAAVVRGSRLAELWDWFNALWIHAAPLDLSKLEARSSRATEVEARTRSATTGLARTGELGWLGEPKRTGAQQNPTSGADRTSVAPHGVAENDVEELAARLRELTEDRTTARTVLILLAKALDHAGLQVDDERLHLNFGRRRRISVTVGQRHIAWCRASRDVREFGMMLQSFTIADDVAATIPGARRDAYTRNGTPVVPELYVPLDQLGRLSPAALEDWGRSIRREVKECGKSSYRTRKRPSLYLMLQDPALRLTAVRLAHPAAWWFGVNNGTAGHITLADVSSVFEGSRLRWPFGRSKTVPSRAYSDMLPGDRVLVWTGHGRSEDWGVIGTAAIESVEDDSVVLSQGTRFHVPLMPYPRHRPGETEAVNFLLRLFGSEFKPLGDVRQAVYGSGRTNPITVARVTDAQVDEVLAYMQRGNVARLR